MFGTAPSKTRMTFQLAALLTLIASLDGSTAQLNFIRSGHPYLAQTRFDPIVSPGKVASHVHKFAGASTLDSTVTYQSLRDAKATTAEVVDDKSLYWQPSLYWKDGNEKLHLVSPAVGLTVYWFGRKTESETFTDIPGGLRMTAGEPYRSTFDSNDVEHQNIGITCFCMEYPGVPKTSCIGAPDVVRTFEEAKQYKCDVVRLDTLFPSCWNGKDLDSDNHRSHMAYPPNGGPCPSSHPKRIPTPFIEGWYFTNTDEIRWPVEGELVLSTGDTTGYGIHGDFFNGFSEGQEGQPGSSILVKAVNNCPDMDGHADRCGELEVVAPQTVQPVNALVDEEIGLGGVLLDKLPGDNPYWSSKSPRADKASSSSGTTDSSSSSGSSGTGSGSGSGSIAAGSASGAGSGSGATSLAAGGSGANAGATQVAASSNAVASSAAAPVASNNVANVSAGNAQVESPATTAAASTTAATTGRGRGGGRQRTRTGVAMNNAHVAEPTPSIIGNNLVNVNGTTSEATEPEGAAPAKMCKKKRSYKRRSMNTV